MLERTKSTKETNKNSNSKSNKELDGCKNALVIKRASMVKAALCALCDSFLVRSGDRDDDPRWIRFYEIQMSSYLLCKKKLEVTPPEGDMVHDLIKDVWSGVREYMDKTPFGPIENMDKWFGTIQIDFPIDEKTSLESLEEFENYLIGSK